VAREPAAAPATKGGAVPLTILLTASLATTAFVHFTASVLSPFLVDDFDWDRWQVGALVTAFSLTGAAGSPAMGRFADRIGGRGALVVLYATNTTGLLLFAVAPGFPTMLMVMMLAGFAASAANPSTNKLIGVHIAPARRGAVMGIKQAGGPIGIAIVGLLPILAGAIGWRAAAGLAASLPAASLIATLAIVPRTAGARSVPGSRGHKVRLPLVRTLALQGFLVGAGGGAVISFLPLFAEEELGFSASSAGGVAIVFGVLGVVGRVLWGWQHRRVGDVGKALQIVTTAAIATPLLVWAAPGTTTVALWVGVALGGLSYMAWNVFAMLAVLEGVPHDAAGRASGDVTLGFLGGFTVAPIAFGLIVDATGSYGWGWLAVGIAFAASALATPRVRVTLSI
jgi:predicted MFS family arabinose efflux permease